MDTGGVQLLTSKVNSNLEVYCIAGFHWTVSIWWLENTHTWINKSCSLPAKSTQRRIIKINPMLERTTKISQEVMNELPHHGFPCFFSRHLCGLESNSVNTKFINLSNSYSIKMGQYHPPSDNSENTLNQTLGIIPKTKSPPQTDTCIKIKEYC